VAEDTKDGIEMKFDAQSCRHQLKRPPDLVSDSEGVSYLLFECLLCGCGISMRLNGEGETDGEFVISRKCA